MADFKDIERAKATFQMLCKALENNDWKFQKDEEKLSIECGARGDDLPIRLNVDIDADGMIAILISHLPFIVQEDKRLDVAIVVSIINNNLVDGCFDFNIETGTLLFRMTNSFLESTISDSVFEYLIFCSCHTIDEYNDKLLMVAKGMLSVEKFIEMEENN